MQIERLQVTNHERWGNLVKTWATGVNYLGDENSYPVPTSMEEFKEQLARAQVFAKQTRLFPFISPQQEPAKLAAAGELPPVAAQRAGDKGDGNSTDQPFGE